MIGGDPRTTPARSDLASDELEGLAPARRYVAPTPARVIRSSAPVLDSARGSQVDQLLFGERFDRIACADGTAWGQARRDGYVGYVDESALSFEPQTPTHQVGVLRTFGYQAPSIKSPAVGCLSLNSLLEIIEEDGQLALAADFGWIPKRHLTPIGTFASDSAAIAEQFLGTPYLWGGRDSVGLDCSGLVQQSLYACGRACPRDSDQQAMLGDEAPATDLRRGDLVFWQGHVGMMLDGERLIHANGHHMAVVIEPLHIAVRRIESAEGRRPIACRRL